MIDFKVLCGWLKELYRQNPERFWNARENAFDIEAVKAAAGKIPVGDIILANAVVRHDIPWLRQTRESVN
jgi:hypothetical protein